MKPVSIIFLVVALLFGIGGYACMVVGQNMAAKEGVDLLSGISDGEENYVRTYEYDSENIGKISVNVKNADVNIIGGSPRAYVELINFADGMYEFSSANRLLTISNNSDFSEITDLASLVFNFKGLRSLINIINIRGLEKTVNIYIKDDCPVKVFDCKVESGNVSVSKNHAQSDYNITVDSGNILLENLTTDSCADIEIESGNLTVDDCDISKISLEIEKGSAELITTYAHQLDAEIDNGDFRFGFRGQLAYVNLSLFADKGVITLDGESKGSSWEVTDLPTMARFDVTVQKGNIALNSDMTGDY